MPNTTIFLFLRCSRNLLLSLLLCACSMTTNRSAHSIKSEETGTVASELRPADITSTPGHSDKTASAVGLRSRFWLQINSNLFITGPAATHSGRSVHFPDVVIRVWALLSDRAWLLLHREHHSKHHEQ